MLVGVRKISDSPLGPKNNLLKVFRFCCGYFLFLDLIDLCPFGLWGIPLFRLSFFHLPNSSGKIHASLTKVRGEDLISSFISIRLSPASAIQSDISFPPSSFDFSHLRADLAKGVQRDNKRFVINKKYHRILYPSVLDPHLRQFHLVMKERPYP